MIGSRTVFFIAFVISLFIVAVLVWRSARKYETSKASALLESSAKPSPSESRLSEPSTNGGPRGESGTIPVMVKTVTPKNVTDTALPVYPNVVSRKEVDAEGMAGEVLWYETENLMEEVVGFFEKQLELEYTYRGPGTVEFILEKEKPSYTFELPNREHPDEPGKTFVEEFEVVWKSILIRYDGEDDRTIIVSQKLDREDVMDRWQRLMEHRAAQIKRGPQLYVPPDQ